MEGCVERVQECGPPLHLQEAWGCKCTVKHASFPLPTPALSRPLALFLSASPSPSCATLDGIYLCR